MLSGHYRLLPVQYRAEEADIRLIQAPRSLRSCVRGWESTVRCGRQLGALGRGPHPGWPLDPELASLDTQLVKKYNLGRNRRDSRPLRREDIDPRVIAAVIDQMNAMREELLAVTADAFAAMHEALAPLRERMPQNWPPPPNGTDLGEFYQVLGEGIPLSFVPDREVVSALLKAPHYEARVAILVERTVEVISDCRVALDEHPPHSALQDVTPLVTEALEVLEAGHYASAQALAVCVIDTILLKALRTRRYWKLKEAIRSNDPEAAFFQGPSCRFAFALQPGISFLEKWDPLNGERLPDHLSRHATIHGASTKHLTAGNAVISVLLATSLLLGVSEWLGASDTPASTG